MKLVDSVYRIISPEKGKAINFTNTDDWDCIIDMPPTPVKDVWTEKEVGILKDRGWVKKKFRKPVFLGTGNLCFWEEDVAHVEKELGRNGEFLPLRFEDKRVYLYHCTTVIDCLDTEKSTRGITLDSGVTLYSYKHFHCEKLKGKYAFYIPPGRGRWFYTNLFKDMMDSLDFTAIDYWDTRTWGA